MGAHDSWRHAFRPKPIGLLASVGVASAAVVTYLALAAWLTLTFDFFAVPPNLIIPALLFFGLTVALRFAQSRATVLVVAAVLPPLITLAVYAAHVAPYIRQNLGLSHTAGHVILVTCPGLVALALAAGASRRDTLARLE